MLHFVKLKKIIAQHNSETKTKIFKAMDVKWKKISCLIFTVQHIISLYTRILSDIEKFKFQ